MRIFENKRFFRPLLILSIIMVACGKDDPLRVTIFDEDGSNNINNSNFGTVINPATGRTWMDRNLGASRVATSPTDKQAYGDLYQWGRGSDGHEKRNSLNTNTLSGSDQPSHGRFILAPNIPNDWRSPQNNNLWQGVNGINNPCPAGFRLPTEWEWEAERLSWIRSDADGAFASPLKLPLAGYRHFNSSSMAAVGSFGYYASSSVSGIYTRFLHIYDFNAEIHYRSNRAVGYSVRCIKN
jgi:hypothetical protein